jgi:hypothetical protein
LGFALADAPPGKTLIFIKKLKKDLKMPHIQAIVKALTALMIYTANRSLNRLFSFLAS